MATLNTSSNGPSISKSYQSVVNAPLPSGAASNSPTYGQWAVYSVAAPLVSAFQQDSGKESVLKVQSTAEGELVDLIDEFSDGRIQFAFAKIKDPNTGLPKCVLIAWCGEGVPERTKGYFTSHLAAVSKLLHGYHVQITCRSDRDITPEGIIQKVADSSGSKYSGGGDPVSSNARAPAPALSSKPVFTPTRSGGGGSYAPLGTRSRTNIPQDNNVDEEGWGADAPQPTRRQLEKVAPAYQPTKVNVNDLMSQKQPASNFTSARQEDGDRRSDVVKGGYQPIGKVDIAALRRQAQESGNVRDDRPTAVKGSYEPVGKVDIAAIRAKAQGPGGSPASTGALTQNDDREEQPKPLAERSAAFNQSGRVTSMPKPKVANRFGSSASNFAGTKAPVPGAFEAKPITGAPPVGTASRTFADEGGKTPAQIWAEKKARQRGTSGAGDNPPSAGFGAPTSPISSQVSGGGGEWKSGYSGKSWAPVSTTRTGQSAASNISEQRTGDEENQDPDASSARGGISAMRDRFSGAPPMRAPATSRDADARAPPPPPMDLASKPNAGAGRGIPSPPSRQEPPAEEAEEEVPDEQHVRLPTPPAQPRSPSPPTPPPVRSGSPIRVAMPVARGRETELEPPEERLSPPPMPSRSLAQAVSQEKDMEDEPQVEADDPARRAAQEAAATSFGSAAVASAAPTAGPSGKRALIQYDYEKNEDNEIELKEGEYVTNIEMVDEDWWMGQNSKGETGLFPSNYVELQEDEEESKAPATPAASAAPPGAWPVEPQLPSAPATASQGKTATAMFDYEAAEENELSFPDGAKITGLEFPDDDWWFGEYGAKSGLFPANYVQLDDTARAGTVYKAAENLEKAIAAQYPYHFEPL